MFSKLNVLSELIVNTFNAKQFYFIFFYPQLYANANDLKPSNCFSRCKRGSSSSGDIYNRSCFCAIMEHLLLIGCKRIVITLNVSRKRFFITGKKALHSVLYCLFFIYIYTFNWVINATRSCRNILCVCSVSGRFRQRRRVFVHVRWWFESVFDPIIIFVVNIYISIYIYPYAWIVEPPQP